VVRTVKSKIWVEHARPATVSGSAYTTVTDTATCPADDRLIGGGGGVTTSSGDAALVNNKPKSKNTWEATAIGLKATKDMTVTAYAICFGPTPPPPDDTISE
jgi:hypothetical protein